MEIKELIGKTLRSYKTTTTARKDWFNRSLLEFRTDNSTIHFYHTQSCCESVDLEDIIGDMSDLLNTPIVNAYESDSGSNEEGGSYNQWVFYTLSTIKGTVVLRFYGSSNGYYSTEVDIREELDDN